MWSWLSADLLQCIVERVPRALAIFALVNHQGRALAAARLARMKPLLTAPFRLTAHQIFESGSSLNLSQRALRSEHVEMLDSVLSVGALDNLITLWLDSNEIGDNGISALAKAITPDKNGKGALASLDTLLLSENEIGEAGMTAFADAVGKGALDKLNFLGLDSNRIDDNGISAFAKAITPDNNGKGALDNLTILRLCFNKIDDAGMGALGSACASGALASLGTLCVDDQEHSALKAACQARDIDLP